MQLGAYFNIKSSLGNYSSKKDCRQAIDNGTNIRIPIEINYFPCIILYASNRLPNIA